jgi:hypothetical protein
MPSEKYSRFGSPDWFTKGSTAIVASAAYFGFFEE